MHYIKTIKAWWQSIPEEKRKKIVNETASVFNTFIAAFLLQIAIDIEATQFVIPLDFTILSSLMIASLRAGIKAVLQVFVAWVHARF
jgi:hypothetical protein